MVVDTFSKWTEAFPMGNNVALATAQRRYSPDGVYQQTWNVRNSLHRNSPAKLLVGIRNKTKATHLLSPAILRWQV